MCNKVRGYNKQRESGLVVQKDEEIDIGLERVGETKRGKGIISSRTDSLKFNSCTENACPVSMSSVFLTET